MGVGGLSLQTQLQLLQIHDGENIELCLTRTLPFNKDYVNTKAYQILSMIINFLLHTAGV